MDELTKIKRVVTPPRPVAPHEVLLVVDASQGQNALAQARSSTKRLGVTGLVITKLDGTAKGGIVLAIASEARCADPLRRHRRGVEDLEVQGREFIAALLGEPGSVIRFENVHKRYPGGREALRRHQLLSSSAARWRS
jgi:fused signal recognition particle receptor